MALDMPAINDLPYHQDKMPTTTPEMVDALAAILRFKIFHQTKKDEHTLATLTGVILYRHLDRHQKMKVMDMIRNEDHIHRADHDELRVFCIEPLIQPEWWLWSLTTEELEEKFKSQENFKTLLSLIGFGVTALSIQDFGKELIKNKKITRGGAMFVLSATFVYLQNKQYNNTKKEVERRKPNADAKSSRFYE